MNPAERPESLPADVDAMPVDELFAELRASKMLEAMEITHEDLLHARSDSDLLATLRITYEVLSALKDSDVLDAFLRLPAADQVSFLRLVGSTDDRELRRHRTHTFVLALEESPLGSG